MKPCWKFITAAAESRADWWWVRCADRRVIERSQRLFASFAACLLDASAHGFVPSGQFEVLKDRRRAPRDGTRLLARTVPP